MVVGFSTASLKLLLVSRLSGRIKVEEKRLRLRNLGEEMIVHPNIPSTLVCWRIHTVRSLRSINKESKTHYPGDRFDFT